MVDNIVIVDTILSWRVKVKYEILKLYQIKNTLDFVLLNTLLIKYTQIETKNIVCA